MGRRDDHRKGNCRTSLGCRGVIASASPWARWLGLILLALGLLATAWRPVQAQPQKGAVVFVTISEQIDLGVAAYLGRVLEEAEQQGAQAVVLEINTPGGRLDAALKMRAHLLSAKVRTVAFVNREAFSAGALIAIAASEIYMAPGAVMGAATPVEQSGETASEKAVSAVRSVFRATAEVRQRNPDVAEAMVDPEVEVEGVSRKGQLLTLTTTTAQETGYANGVATNRDELLKAIGLEGAPRAEPEISWAERLVRVLTHPVLASLLMSAGFLLILADLYSGGFGVVGLIGVLLLGTFFWGHFLAGLAGWEGVALVVLGIALIALEVLVIPGFGVAGIAGILALVGGLGLSLIRGELVTWEDLQRATLTMTMTVVFIAVGGVILARFLPRSSWMQGLVLRSHVGHTQPPRWEKQPGQPPAPNATDEFGHCSLRGAEGVALSDLRPAGVAEINGERVDVVSQGNYIRAGETVVVIADEGYRRVVQRKGSPPTAA